MSRLFMTSSTAYLDEANGNTLLSSPAGSPGAGPAAGAGAGGGTVDPGASETLIIQSPSNDDLSQSLSEYTDADESISAPTELLAEFLSAVMLRDYVSALKYCKLILQYEPNNSTARDFYPHILSKIAAESAAQAELQAVAMTGDQQSGESDENYNFNYSTSSSNSDDICIDEVVMVCSSDSEQSSNCSSFLDYSNSSNSSGAGSGSDLDEKALNRINCNSTESDQLPPSQSATDNNTSHSYSSLLLEEEEKDLTLSDISNLNIEDDENGDDSDNGPQTAPKATTTAQPAQQVVQQQSSKEQSVPPKSSQPSTPLASKLVAMLRAKVIPSSKSSNND
uniref:Glutamate-rich protein 2 n=1 Tax=Culex pipiens TaxID=7175 RepID=A0A8D8DW20_CULPI